MFCLHLTASIMHAIHPPHLSLLYSFNHPNNNFEDKNQEFHHVMFPISEFTLSSTLVSGCPSHVSYWMVIHNVL